MQTLISKFLALVLVFCFTFLPVNSIESPYLAVFSTPEFKKFWGFYHPDLLFVSSNWGDFHDFILEAKKQAGDRKLIIDISCHGCEDGLLYLNSANRKKKARANVSYILNEISNIPPDHIKMVCLEACYAGFCYSNKNRCLRLEHNMVDRFEYSNTVPMYPIYGVTNTVNLITTIFLEKSHELNVGSRDLRFERVVKCEKTGPSKYTVFLYQLLSKEKNIRFNPNRFRLKD